jgi:hypothetical protein
LFFTIVFWLDYKNYTNVSQLDGIFLYTCK